MTKVEAAALLRVSPRTLSRWQAEGMGPPRIKCGKQVLYDRANLIKWFVSHQTTPPRCN
ncbi:MAG: helix-turn-helix domain-containing protein [Loktanella sp.]|nr:helix-turn-helix domain-containing protein [Loktanella sp.]